MGKRPFKSQASSSRLDPESGFGGFGSVFTGSTLSYVSEPPNLTSITDANVAVAFKNLTKKDSTTKSKALEDLRSYVRSHPYENAGGVEQPILEAWVKIYPHMSIDNSRRVRELSHNLQYGLLISARKRMEKYIPSTVGPWLAGIYDKDRAVSRAATNGINSFLDSEEKVISFWRRCQSQILAYAQEAMKETPQTLSDERSVSVDDAQAKYDRVMGSSLSLVLNLLMKLDNADVEKQRGAYTDFFLSHKTPWEFIACQDSSLRRISAQLFLVCIDNESDIIKQNLEVVSHTFLSEGLRTPQNGSALDFLHALSRATEKFPQIWLSVYKGKKSVLSRLRHFVGKGSQGGPPQFWQSLAALILRLPYGVLPADLDGAVDFLKAYREGISSRDEASRNGPAARNSYLDVVGHFGSYLSEPGTFEKLLRIAVFPAFGEFLHMLPDDANWSMGNSVEELANSFQICCYSDSSKIPQLLQEEWMRLADSLIARLRMDLPEPPEPIHHDESLVTVAAEAGRWFDLQAKIINSATESESKISDDSFISFLKDPSSRIVNAAIEVLKNGNDRLDGAAGTLAAALRFAPKLLNCIPSIHDDIASFLEEEFPRLVVSPIPLDLIDAFHAFRNLPNRESQFKAIWQAGINRLLDIPDDSWKMIAINRLIASHSTSQFARQESGLQAYLLAKISSLIKGFDEDWGWFEDSIRFDLLDVETFNHAASVITNYLKVHDGPVDGALQALDLIVRKKPQLLQNGNLVSATIITRLLVLTESSDPSIVSKVKVLRVQIERASEIMATKGPSTSLTLDILRDNLENAGPQTLSIDILVDQARDFIQTEHGGMNPQLFPNTTLWLQALMPLLEHAPSSSLEIATGVGPVLPLVRPMSNFSTPQLSRDIRGYSIPFRMAIYTSKIFAGKPLMAGISVIDQVEILRLLNLTIVLASDQLELQEDDELCLTWLDPYVERDISNLLHATRLIMISLFSDATSWCGRDAAGSSIVAQRLIADLIATSRGNSPLAFYSARALAKVVVSLVGIHGWKVSSGDEWLSSLDILNKSTSNPFAGVAILSSLLEFLDTSKLVGNLCNRLLSDMTDASATDEKTFKLLLLLNATLSIYQSPNQPPNLPIAQNRVIFAVKHIIEWMHDDQVLPLSIASEAFRALQFLMISLGAIYGPHWEVVIKYCARFWNDEHAKQAHDQLAALNSSVRLIRMLQNLQDPNEDLSEALEEHGASLSNGLVLLLMVKGRCDTQPWRLFDDVLWRLSSEIPPHHIKNISILYPLLASEFMAPQTAAYVILCHAVPASQEQISIDIILENKDAQLPEELLSLLLETPSVENYPDDDLRGFPSSFKTYLFSWKLVFSSYPKASEKARNDYNKALKAGNYMSPLLGFLSDILGHSKGRPFKLDPAKIPAEDIQSYDAKHASSGNESHHLLWLSVHLYHQCLKFAPGLTKGWWMNCKSKQTRMALESWTEKHISSLIIADTLDGVMAWAAQQEATSEEDKEMIVKISKNAREVYAGFEIDETQMQIVIRLPATYPLEGVKVDGVNRVAVSEKKWQSWLMITQGVITFSNSSIVEGLIAFRKNVTGALKGHTECAICYSIISSDKKMPDKRCQTCKNLFHASCLFKWFASSNQSSCPLCRNPFNYGAGWDVASRARRRGGPE